jgi:hypothetical protein
VVPIRPTQRFELGAGFEPPPGAGVSAAGRRSLSVRRAVVRRPPGRRTRSAIRARPPAARSALTARALKRSVIVLTDSRPSRTLRRRIVRLPTVTVATPRTA